MKSWPLKWVPVGGVHSESATKHSFATIRTTVFTSIWSDCTFVRHSSQIFHPYQRECSIKNKNDRTPYSSWYVTSCTILQLLNRIRTTITAIHYPPVFDTTVTIKIIFYSWYGTSQSHHSVHPHTNQNIDWYKGTTICDHDPEYGTPTIHERQQ